MKLKKLKYAHWFLTVYNFLFGNVKPKGTLRPDQEFKRIVVYSTTALGDFMFNTPTMRAIRNRYPSAHITLVAGTINRGMVKDYSCFDEVIFWDNKFRQMRGAVAEIRKRRPELAVILHAHLPYDIISAVLAGCQYILRDNYLTLPKGIDRWVYSCSLNFSGHLIQRKLDLMNFIGGDTTNIEMEIPCQFEKLSQRADVIRIGFNMGASSKERCWPVEYFAELANKLITRHNNVEVVIIGSPADREIESIFMAHLATDVQSRIVSYVGKTSLPQLVGVIDSLNVLLTGDTGPLHLAVALKVPTLSLFVTAKPRFTGPYQNKEIHCVIDLSERYEGTVISSDELPLAIIPVARVYDSLEDMKILPVCIE
ncbi:glycosyltransferase family 9 protein [Serratia sp. CY49633]|uniref:glycosyltransferase family 9 protein n=1 Tax=Serratia TaxID=613 RepID=UPI000949BC5C|nr:MULTISPECIES: glycosyltransferase family 9 protein [Serratia]AVD65293.1 glycosyltransferase family 9 protein [Serratia marcescens]ELH4210164.1 glycosyltransferase family 9 protein [Serratia marcescens]ELL0334965.1 glycosyltransferase family 9 protein [Serratia marcescens]MBH2552279.1 glycosyltransferase family 9 protein [Serratia marcescens]MBH2571700.1 glycosyltransferase family 9 protein [Serratia marcescens]